MNLEESRGWDLALSSSFSHGSDVAVRWFHFDCYSPCPPMTDSPHSSDGRSAERDKLRDRLRKMTDKEL
jgi:hypothetical protein